MPATIAPLPSRDASHLLCWHSDSEPDEEFPGLSATVLTKRQKLRRRQQRRAKEHEQKDLPRTAVSEASAIGAGSRLELQDQLALDIITRLEVPLYTLYDKLCSRRHPRNVGARLWFQYDHTICDAVYNFVEQYKAFRICGDFATEFFAIALRALKLKPASVVEAWRSKCAVEDKWREAQEHPSFGLARDDRICTE